MSNLIPDSELLTKIIENKRISRDEAYQIYQEAENDPSGLFEVAKKLRTKNKGNIVTYSRKVFFNLINLCRDTCSYCTYKAEPGQAKLSLMTKQQIKQLAAQGKEQKCTEALFVTGERPEQKYQEARNWLKENGFSSTAEYLVHASEIALGEGLFPHTNAGNLTKSEMRELKETNASLGLMLENSSVRLAMKDMPHYMAPSKNPKARLKVLENSGELGIPMTTGLLIGIGESPFEIIDSIYSIKSLHEKFGNIQEVILQNFHPKPDTIMSNTPSPHERYFKILVALCRVILPEMNIQIPPNLSPKSYQGFLNAGINDWGGISPITPDYVNPELPWPKIRDIEKNCNEAGFIMRSRFPVYPEYFAFVNNNLKEKMLEISDEYRLVSMEYTK